MPATTSRVETLNTGRFAESPQSVRIVAPEIAVPLGRIPAHVALPVRSAAVPWTFTVR